MHAINQLNYTIYLGDTTKQIYAASPTMSCLINASINSNQFVTIQNNLVLIHVNNFSTLLGKRMLFQSEVAKHREWPKGEIFLQTIKKETQCNKTFNLQAEL